MKRRSLVAAAAASAWTVLTFATIPAIAADWDAAQLFDRLAKERPARAQFHERKYLALLSEPVDSSGELLFTPPDRLEKRTLSPKPESVTVDRTHVTLERGGRTQTLDLKAYPAIGVLVESIRATLTGDLASLSREYTVELAGDASGWRLMLRPLDAALTPIVDRIEIGGVQAQVRTVETFQPDGDRSVMTITPTTH